MNLEPDRFFVAKRHVRVTNSSPGSGRTSSDIFNTSGQQSPARKVRDNFKSSIENTGVGIDTNGNMKRSAFSPRRQENTQNRLFGGDSHSDTSSPRRNNDTWRSNIMFTDAADGQIMTDGAKRTPKKRFPSGGLNPITGTSLKNGHSYSNGMNGTSSYDHDDVLTVVLNSDGPVAVLNGHNGHHDGDQPATPRRQAAQLANQQ